MTPPARTDVDAILASRALALYLVGLVSLANAILAFWPPGASRTDALAAWAALLAFAQLLGDALVPRLAGLDRARRTRLRLVAATAYAGLLGMALLVAFVSPEPRLLRTIVTVFAWVHVLFLVSAGVSQGSVAPLANALVLVVLSSIPGGLVAAVATTSYAGLLVVFLVLDHFAGALSFYPTPAGRWHGVALREALSAAALLAAALLVFFLAAPPQPYAPFLRRAFEDPAAREANLAAYRLIAFLCLLGAAAIRLAGRLLGPRRRKPKEQELVVAERAADEAIAAATPSGRVVYEGARGRVVRAYVGFLGRASRLGWKRRPDQTPSEFLARAREGGAPLAALTELFVRARYGREEPADPEARAAEDAAEAATALLGRLRRA